MNYKVLITAAGTGSRLGELTKNTNKLLVMINGRPAISYLLDSYAAEIPIVIAVGYLKDQVIDFVRGNYPEREIEFAVVDKYDGPGSSLVYSMLRAEKFLQCPFVFHACDTIVTEPVPAPETNWLGGYKTTAAALGEQAKQYRTHKVESGKITRLNDKGVLDFESVHIGLVGIKDFADFWKAARMIYDGDHNNSAWSDVHVEEMMMRNGTVFDWAPFNVWLDTGNPDALQRTEKYFRNSK